MLALIQGKAVSQVLCMGYCALRDPNCTVHRVCACVLVVSGELCLTGIFTYRTSVTHASGLQYPRCRSGHG